MKNVGYVIHALGIFACCVAISISYFDPTREPLIFTLLKSIFN